MEIGSRNDFLVSHLWRPFFSDLLASAIASKCYNHFGARSWQGPSKKDLETDMEKIGDEQKEDKKDDEIVSGGGGGGVSGGAVAGGGGGSGGGGGQGEAAVLSWPTTPNSGLRAAARSAGGGGTSVGAGAGGGGERW